MKKSVFIMLLITLFALAAPALSQELWATVNNPDPQERLNLRAKPSTEAISYGKYYNGTQVQILSGPRNGWYHVRVGMGNGVSEIDGYMMARYLAVGEKGNGVIDARPVVTVRVAQGDLVLLKDFISGSNVGKVQDGERATVLGVGTAYLHVVCEDGDTGMLQADLSYPRLYFSSEEE